MRTLKQIEQSLWRKLNEAAQPAAPTTPPKDTGMSAAEKARFKAGLIGRESTGSSTAVNKASGASGLGQFLKSTFTGMVNRAKPGSPLYGKTWDEYKKDPKLQMTALDIAINGYERMLNKANLPVSYGNLHMLHHFNPSTAIRMLKNPESKLSDYFPEQVPMRDKKGKVMYDKKTGEVMMKQNKVYAQNPHLKPEGTVSQLNQLLLARSQPHVDKYDKQLAKAQGKPDSKADTQVAQADARKIGTGYAAAGKLAALGNRALAAVTGSTSAQAGELPADKRAALAKAPTAPTVPGTDRFTPQSTAPAPTVDTGEIRAAGGLDTPEPPKDWWDQIDHNALSIAAPDSNDIDDTDDLEVDIDGADDDYEYDETPPTPAVTTNESIAELQDILRLAGRVK